ncbi:MAG: hypothetical protein KDK90_10810 [Leptospiraceae bacterium]|nr:hypothetical protein [Leptospiraceae bacterium]
MEDWNDIYNMSKELILLSNLIDITKNTENIMFIKIYDDYTISFTEEETRIDLDSWYRDYIRRQKNNYSILAKGQKSNEQDSYSIINNEDFFHEAYHKINNVFEEIFGFSYGTIIKILDKISDSSRIKPSKNKYLIKIELMKLINILKHELGNNINEIKKAIEFISQRIPKILEEDSLIVPTNQMRKKSRFLLSPIIILNQ